MRFLNDNDDDDFDGGKMIPISQWDFKFFLFLRYEFLFDSQFAI